jgi:type I restriction enzyme, S subunit
MKEAETGQQPVVALQELPPGWRWTTVGSVSSLVQYGSSSKTTEKPDGIPVLRMGNIVDGRVSTEKLKYLPTDHPEFPDLLLETGDVLFNRTNSSELVGKTAVYSGNPHPCSFASYLIRVRLTDSYEPKLLSYYLNSVFGRNWISSVLTQQVGQANVNGSKLKSLQIPVPPRAEQSRIVAEIEKQFTRLDAAVASLKRAQANLKRYRAAVIRAACEGRLVPTEAELARAQCRDYEPADRLLERVYQAHRVVSGANRQVGMSARGIQPASVRFRPDNAFGPGNKHTPLDLHQLPEGWTWASLESMSAAVVDCPHSTPKWTESGPVCVRTTEFLPGKLDLSGARHVSESTYRERIGRLEPREGDILYSREGGILGIACMVPPSTKVCLGQRMMLVRVHETIPARYVMWVLNSKLTLDRVRGLIGGSASPHLNVGDVKTFPIPVPPSAEARRIIDEVDRRLLVADRFEGAIAFDLARTIRLRQSILRLAFEGKLVSKSSLAESGRVTMNGRCRFAIPR